MQLWAKVDAEQLCQTGDTESVRAVIRCHTMCSALSVLMSESRRQATLFLS